MTQDACFQLKGSAFTLTVLQLFHKDLDNLSKELGEKVSLAPQFFNHTPVVIDLHELDQKQTDLDFKRLKEIICSFSMIPVGIKGAIKSQCDAIRDAGLAVLAEAKTTSAAEQKEAFEKEKPATQEVIVEEKIVEKIVKETVQVAQQTMLVNHNVRSGQQIYAPNGDLVIKGSVGAGSEVLADGNIHIYGSLRGKAMAGVKGEKKANIFCHNLESELISIAGIYVLRDDLPSENEGKANHISLADEKLTFNTLD